MTEIAARHVPIGVGGNEQFCLPCQTDWPCDTARVLALLAAAERRVTELEAALDEIAEGTTPDRIGQYGPLRDWVHKTARALLRDPEATVAPFIQPPGDTHEWDR